MMMMYDDATRRFSWPDKYRQAWDVYVFEEGNCVSWYARLGNVGGKYEATLETHSHKGQRLAMAHLIDVMVDERMENRGLGSMLVKEAIKEARRLGHKGIEGYLSSVDRDNFPKLKHFYKKLGFSVVFYEPEHPDYQFHRVGKVEMVFQEQ